MPIAPGPVALLVSAAGPARTGSCTFRGGFTVPDIEPGLYRVPAVFGVVDSTAAGAGYAIFVGHLTFRVTK
jgi:hypothetical protein